MQLTKRDLEILTFINEFGFCETKQLGAKFGLLPYRVNRLMRRLLIQELVIKERIIYGRDASFRLTEKGALFTNLPKLSKISLGGYFHSIGLVDLYLKLITHFPGCRFISERQLRHDSGVQVGQTGHICDGLLLHDGLRIALELELTTKKQFRLETILRSYATNLEIDQVWYFCSRTVMPSLSKLAGKMSHVKIFDFELYLTGGMT